MKYNYETVTVMKMCMCIHTGWRKKTHVFEMGSTSERYVEMLRNFLRPQLRSLRVNMEEMLFQQDGATAHMARASMTDVRQMFLQHVVSRFGDVPWPPTVTRFICLRFLSLGLLDIKSLRLKTSYSR
jgi:hypothetical protein